MVMAGMASADGTALLMVRHPDIDQQEVLEVLRRRWPSAIISDIADEQPSREWPLEDIVELANVRRGVEPLRIVVLGQRVVGPGKAMYMGMEAAAVDPMPVVI